MTRSKHCRWHCGEGCFVNEMSEHCSKECHAHRPWGTNQQPYGPYGMLVLQQQMQQMHLQLQSNQQMHTDQETQFESNETSELVDQLYRNSVITVWPDHRAVVEFQCSKPHLVEDGQEFRMLFSYLHGRVTFQCRPTTTHWRLETILDDFPPQVFKKMTFKEQTRELLQSIADVIDDQDMQLVTKDQDD